jgi:hypothetical protein
MMRLPGGRKLSIPPNVAKPETLGEATRSTDDKLKRRTVFVEPKVNRAKNVFSLSYW